MAPCNMVCGYSSVPPARTFKNFTFYPHHLFMCCRCFWQWTANTSTSSINQLYLTQTQYLFYSYRALSYIQYVNQQMHWTKYNKIQFMVSINSYMFRHWSTISRESTKTRNTSPTRNPGTDHPHCHYHNIKIFNFVAQS